MPYRRINLLNLKTPGHETSSLKEVGRTLVPKLLGRSEFSPQCYPIYTKIRCFLSYHHAFAVAGEHARCFVFPQDFSCFCSSLFLES